MKKSDIALAIGAALPFLMGGSSKTKLQFNKSEFERFQQGMPIQTVGSAALDWSKQQFAVFNSSKQERLIKSFHDKLAHIINLPVLPPDYHVITPYDPDYNLLTEKLANWGMFSPGLELPPGDLLLASSQVNNSFNGIFTGVPSKVVSRALLGSLTNYDMMRKVPFEFYQDFVIAGGFYMPMNIALRVFRMIISSENSKLSGKESSRLHGFVVLYGPNDETALVSSAWFATNIRYTRSGQADFIQFINYLCQKNNMFVGYKYGEGLDELSTIGDVGYLAFQDHYDFQGRRGQFDAGEFLQKMPNILGVDVELAIQGDKVSSAHTPFQTEVKFKGRSEAVEFRSLIFPVAFPSYEFH
jgi:hypothetical protein